jgi:hypothetical protein
MAKGKPPAKSAKDPSTAAIGFDATALRDSASFKTSATLRSLKA